MPRTVVLLCLLLCHVLPVDAGGLQPNKPSGPKAVTRLGPTLVQVGSIRVETRLRELRVPGRLNQVTTLEFIANTPGGLKAYESAMTVESDAATFNTALLLLGLDPERARVPAYHFDPVPPRGDPVEILVEWKTAEGIRRVKVEELLYHTLKGRTIAEGPWVYTGSLFNRGRLLAEDDGVLIGFVHSPAPLIEYPRPVPASNYGELVLNPKLGLGPGSPVTLVVRALDRPNQNSK